MKLVINSCAPRPCPVSRIGWHEFYARRFSATGSGQAAHLALWYLLLHLALEASDDPA